MAFVLDPVEREAFKTCRRAWDLGSPNRRNLQPKSGRAAPDLRRALCDSLAVWYFPGMWRWGRDIVRPLAFDGFDQALARQRARSAAPRPPGDAEDRAWQAAAERGRRLLGDYFDWAPGQDRFTPVRVEVELEVHVPDVTGVADEGRALVTAAGDAVDYRDHIDMVVVDEGDDSYWIVEHRVGESAFTDPHLLALDERSLAACWAWGQAYLSTPAAGVIHNELLVDPRPDSHRFRRTAVRRRPDRLRRHLAQMASEVRDMTDPDVATYPHPGPQNCSACLFRSPCLALAAGEAEEAERQLRSSYRTRPEPEVEPGRLGATTWSIGRGAAPRRPGPRL